MANTPHIKFESSPAESLVDSFASTPGTQYPSLFHDTMDLSHVMTPRSFDEDSMFGDENGSSVGGTPAPEKKQVKKRKSWGQQLPEPKTNLPPRKRAKTDDEKEQRRVERVLRNRRAAQSSRERKRQEVEALEAEKGAIERRNKDLELQLADVQASNALLQRELEKLTGRPMRVFQGSSASTSPVAEPMRAPTPVTFSQELFGARDHETVHRSSISTQPIVDARTFFRYDTTSCRDVVRPAVSVGRTTALDDLSQSDNYNDLSNFVTNAAPEHDFSSYFDAPEPSESDRQFLEHGILPVADSFNLNYDYMVGHNDGVLDDFNLDDYLHQHDDQPAPEIQSSDSLAETTASLQPPLGASSYGCDDGGNAVSV